MGLGHLAAGPNDHHDEAAGHDDHADAAGTLDLRIIAIFAIALGALACGLPPIFLRAFQSPDAPVARVARAFAGGIILALALVHIVPEAVMELSEIVEYPVGGVAVLVGILALVMIDSSLTALWAPKDYKQQLLAGVAPAPQPGSKRAAAAFKPIKSGCGHGHAAKASNGGNDAGSGSRDTGADAHGHADADAHHAHADKPPKDAAAAVALAVAAVDEEAAAAARAPHTHSCTSSLTAQRWLESSAGAGAPLSNIRQRVTAYTMELGCIFHSVIIGVGVGVITSDRQLVIVLMVALIVHQGLEGMSLGTVLALTHFSRAKKVVMAVTYSLTTSIGIAIGIAASATYDPDGVTAKAVQGTLNGVSGGMLLYISMYQLIAEEFSREDLVVRGRLRAAMICGLLLGACSMCVLAVWS